MLSISMGLRVCGKGMLLAAVCTSTNERVLQTMRDINACGRGGGTYLREIVLCVDALEGEPHACLVLPDR